MSPSMEVAPESLPGDAPILDRTANQSSNSEEDGFAKSIHSTQRINRSMAAEIKSTSRLGWWAIDDLPHSFWRWELDIMKQTAP